MPTYHALIPKVGSSVAPAYLSESEATAVRGALLLDVTGFTGYGLPDAGGNTFRDPTGPKIPAPGEPFDYWLLSSMPSDYSGVGGGPAEFIEFDLRSGYAVPDALVLQFVASSNFGFGLSAPNRRAYFLDDLGIAALCLVDLTGTHNLGVSSIKVWEAADAPIPSDFWTDFILAREVP